MKSLQLGWVLTDEPLMEDAAKGSSTSGARCPHCNLACTDWITSCPDCGTTLQRGESMTSLESQLAPVIDADITWIDIPVASDEPAKVALLISFLKSNRIQYDESKRFVSIPYSSAGDVITAIGGWALHNDLIDDPRHTDSLAATLKEVGAAVLWAIDDRDGVLTARLGACGLDLR